MDVDNKRDAFEFAVNIKKSDSFYFDDKKQQYVATKAEARKLVDDFNEAYVFWSTAWDMALTDRELNKSRIKVC